jgi:hypothetical protein
MIPCIFGVVWHRERPVSEVVEARQDTHPKRIRRAEQGQSISATNYCTAGGRSPHEAALLVEVDPTQPVRPKVYTRVSGGGLT